MCSGLPCYVSDSVPKEVAIGKNIYFLPLNLGVEAWAEKILEGTVQERSEFFEQNINSINKYNIYCCFHILMDKYKEMVSDDVKKDCKMDEFYDETITPEG